MRSSGSRWVARTRTAVVCAAVASACSGKLPARAPPPDPPRGAGEPGRLSVSPVFWPGESAEMSLRFANVEVARLQYAVGEPGIVAGRRAIRVRSLTVSDGVLAVVVKLHEEVISSIDTVTGQPITNRGSFLGLFTGNPDGGAEDRPWTDPDGLNTHAFIGMLRGWIAPPGTRAYFDLVVAGYRNRVDLVMAGHETVRGHNGLYPAARIEGAVQRSSGNGEPRRFVAWVSDDALRLLLRVDAETDYGGILSARLVGYHRP